MLEAVGMGSCSDRSPADVSKHPVHTHTHTHTNLSFGLSALLVTAAPSLRSDADAAEPLLFFASPFPSPDDDDVLTVAVLVELAAAPVALTASFSSAFLASATVRVIVADLDGVCVVEAMVFNR